ncbi:MAG: nicotinate (nicotinamide) nucleotide adenylyltransferase [Rhodoferax sp.]|nr:nicotinate (nicotinamide) nucleotide adenylyltransferase [Rhodoferax sp.]
MSQAVVSPAAGRRVGFLGGAFDPPHRAHRALAQAALSHLQLDELRIVPTGQAWHKPRTLTPGVHRLAMVGLALGDLPGAVVDRCELDRSGPSYTVDTLEQWRSGHPGDALFLIIGADQARALPTWHRWQHLLTIATICVAERPESTWLAARNNAQNAPQAIAPLRGRDAGFGSWRTLPMPAMPLSATAIRQRLAAGQDVAEWVTEPVARYIALHRLYQRP